jgi:hypothetical protein
MPTGYTAKLYEGEQSFEDFVLRCARGMGALATMRDDPMDAPIPDRFEPDPYYRDSLARSEAKLAEAEAWTEDEAFAEWQTAYATQVDSRAEVASETAAKRVRYERMLAAVKAWEPPTPDHQGFKDFMIEQLTGSIDFDCSNYEWPDPPVFAVWRDEELERRRRRVEMDRESWADEQRRAAERTAWVRALKGSLAVPVP